MNMFSIVVISFALLILMIVEKKRSENYFKECMKEFEELTQSQKEVREIIGEICYLKGYQDCSDGKPHDFEKIKKDNLFDIIQIIKCQQLKKDKK